MAFYPAEINKRFCFPRHCASTGPVDAEGTAASMVCGTYLRFSIAVDMTGKHITDAAFSTNGCGFAVAAADFLAEEVSGSDLTNLKGLDRDALALHVAGGLGPIPPERHHCIEMCIDAVHDAFANYRASRLNEAGADKALICTCFGVSEIAIEDCISQNRLRTVNEVASICRAGTGCGACRMLIQEIIDDVRRSPENA